VVSCVIGDGNNLLALGAAAFLKIDQEGSKGLAVKLFRLPLVHKAAVANANGSIITHAVTHRSVKHNGVFRFGWYPHTAPRSVLLEVDFVQSPHVDVRVGQEVPKFF
jgi:hypothetical protein